jgi:hypothetical protein
MLRAESIAPSEVEGLQADARSLARAEAKADVGKNIGSDVAEVLANLDAMELAVEETAAQATITLDSLVAIHESLMRRAPNASIAGQVRDVQNWIGGNDYNPCGASFVPSPPEHVAELLDDLCEFCNSDHLPPLIQAAVAHAQFETIYPSKTETAAPGEPSSTCWSADADSHRATYHPSASSSPPTRIATSTDLPSTARVTSTSGSSASRSLRPRQPTSPSATSAES